jgi:hypothetical protein
MIRTHSTHPDEEDDGPFKWISPGDTKVSAIAVIVKLSLIDAPTFSRQPAHRWQ